MAGDGAFNRPMAGIVDARSHFVGEEIALMFKKFDGEDTNVFQRFEDAVSCALGGALDAGIEAWSGREREAEDAAAVMVFDERVDGGFSGAGTDGEDGEFAGEGNKLFENQTYARKFRFGFGDVFGSAKNPLALAIVAHATGFEDGGKAERIYGGFEFGRVRDRSEFGGGDAEFAEERFFGEAILRGF